MNKLNFTVGTPYIITKTNTVTILPTTSNPFSKVDAPTRVPISKVIEVAGKTQDLSSTTTGAARNRLEGKWTRWA